MAKRGMTTVEVKCGRWAQSSAAIKATYTVQAVLTVNNFLVITRHLVNPERFVITHIPTGFAVCNNFPDVATAKLVAAAMNELFDWRTEDYWGIKQRFETFPKNLQDWIVGWSLAN